MNKDNTPLLSIRSLSLDIENKNQNAQFKDMDFQPGDTVLIKGNNGSGKTTFFKLFTHFGRQIGYYQVSADSKIYMRSDDDRIDEKNIFSLSHDHQDIFKRSFSIVRQNDHEVFQSFTFVRHYLIKRVQKALKNNSSLSKQEKRETDIKGYIETKYGEHLKKVFRVKNLNRILLRPIKSFSSGQMKLIHILSEVLSVKFGNKKVFILDEPLNSLDAPNKKFFNNLLMDLKEERPDLLIFIITHCQVLFGFNKTLKYTKMKKGQYTVDLITHHENLFPVPCLFDETNKSYHVDEKNQRYKNIWGDR